MKHILLVDDEVQWIEMIKTRLEGNGYKVTTAFEGKEGIAKARAEQPDLILIDIMMPELNGSEAVKILSQDEKTKKIPIVFLTAVCSHEQQGDRAINVGERFYPAVAKPVHAPFLFETIGKQLG